MNQIERLTAIISQARRELKGAYASAGDIDRAIAERLVEKGAVLLPCKVGDTVYHTDGVRVYESTVQQVIYDTNIISFDERAIGSTIFLARKEAEEALCKIQSNVAL